MTDPLLTVPQGSKPPCLMTLDQAPFFPYIQNSHCLKLFNWFNQALQIIAL